jgi:hypothetical protein
MVRMLPITPDAALAVTVAVAAEAAAEAAGQEDAEDDGKDESDRHLHFPLLRGRSGE